MKPGISTRILHADRLAGTEHDAVHKPLHVAATYAYPNSRALADVFQGRQSVSYTHLTLPTIYSV